jgi:hypothetical protein
MRGVARVETASGGSVLEEEVEHRVAQQGEDQIV